MSLPRSLLLVACISSPLAQAQAPQLSPAELQATEVQITPERDAAADFMRQHQTLLTRQASSCRKLLGLPAQPYGQPEADLWYRHHYRLSVAAVRYEAKRDKLRDGLASYQLARARMDKAYEQAEQTTSAWLKAAPDAAQACQRFFDDSAAGRLNMGPEHPHMAALEELARQLFDPRPASAAASAP